MKLMISVPTTGYLRAEIDDFVQAAKAVFRARGWVLDYRKPRDRPTASCRCRQVHDFMATPYDYVLTMDHDCSPTRPDGSPDIDGLLRLCDAIQKPEVDIVAGWTLIQREEGDESDMFPCVSGAPQDGEWPIDFVRPYTRENPMQEITGGGIGTHCLMVKRRVFEGFRAAGRIWFEDIMDRDPASPDWGCRTTGHDFMFAKNAADLGFRVWLRNDVLWGHRKDVDLRWIHDTVRGMSGRMDSHVLVAHGLLPDVETWIVLRTAEEAWRLNAVRAVFTGVLMSKVIYRLFGSAGQWSPDEEDGANLILVEGDDPLPSGVPYADRRVLISAAYSQKLAMRFVGDDDATVEKVGEGMVVRCGF